MQLQERQRAFLEAVKERFKATKKTKVTQAFGVSNSAKVIEGGIQLGVSNLENFGEDVDAYLLLCVIRFPPEDEVYFALRVVSGLAPMAERLADMKRLGAAAKPKDKSDGEGEDEESGEETQSSDSGGIAYSHRNNLAVCYLAATDGRMYFRNKRFWESLKFDLSTMGPAVAVDEIAVAIYPPAASARRSTLAREFVGYLAKMIGRTRVHEIDAFPDERAVGDSMRRMPAILDVMNIRTHIEGLGGHYVDDLVERYHEALNYLPTKHFAILKGLSGTGKTQLALHYARAVHGLGMGEPDPLLFVVPVRPEWTDPTGLTGYHDVLTNRYVVPPFLEAILVATAYRESPVFVVLDEMNLARVEHYFSDILSAMESGHPIQLHSSSVPLEGSTGGEIRAEVAFPPNLFLTGTINVDETTNPVSDKVLDRAVTIDMSAIDRLSGLLREAEGQRGRPRSLRRRLLASAYRRERRDGAARPRLRLPRRRGGRPLPRLRDRHRPAVRRRGRRHADAEGAGEAQGIACTEAHGSGSGEDIGRQPAFGGGRRAHGGRTRRVGVVPQRQVRDSRWKPSISHRPGPTGRTASGLRLSLCPKGRFRRPATM